MVKEIYCILILVSGSCLDVAVSSVQLAVTSYKKTGRARKADENEENEGVGGIS